MDYKVIDNDHVMRMTDGAIIPLADPNNSACKSYMLWREGYRETRRDMLTGEALETVTHAPNAPLPADIPVPTVPQSITIVQAQKALSRMGMLQAMIDAIKLLPEEDQIEWNKSVTVNRNNPIVIGQLLRMGLSVDQGDGLFIFADTL